MPGKRVPALAELPHQVVAAAVRQSQVADQQVEGSLLGQLQGRGHVAGHFDRVAVRGQHHPHHLRRHPWSSTSRMRKGRAGRAGKARRARRFGSADRAPSSGSRTRNVAPLSRPSLWASIVPPCISTSALLIANPRPRPPNCRVIERSACSKALKIRGSASGSMPMPLSLTSTSDVPRFRPAADAHAAAVRRELDGVLQQVPEDLLEPGGVGLDPVGGGRPQVHAEMQPPGLDVGLADLDRAAE